MSTPFKALAELCERLEATRKRVSMIEMTAKFIKGLEPNEVEPAVSMILGRPLQGRSRKTLDVSWATLGALIRRTAGVSWERFLEVFGKTGDIGSATKTIFEESKIKRQATLLERCLTITEVRRSFEDIAEATGHGSREKKERLIEALLSLASPLEAKYIVKIFIGEMRTGFHEGLMEQAVSKAFKIPLETVQKASMAIGDVAEVAAIARNLGEEGLAKAELKVFRPVKPMLAQIAENVAEALEAHGGKTAFEYKLDGVRVQIHKLGDNVKIFSRRLTDVTESLPEIVEDIKRGLNAEEAIIEGEIIAVDKAGNPIPFQHLMRRFKRVHSIANKAEKIPVRLYLFDVLYLNGESLITLSYLSRRQKLAGVTHGIPLTKQMITDNVEAAEKFLNEALDSGHEGLMAKKLDSPYTVGTRGKNWYKIKPVLEPLDLVVTAAEYGYGRRHNWLSDYYLAARDSETGEYLIVGKTFKGLTDSQIIEMTQLLKDIAVKEDARRVVVIPKIVVEVIYNEIQKSPKYKCGMALRFARIRRIREDKSPEEADTIQRVKEIYEKQFFKKGKYII